MLRLLVKGTEFYDPKSQEFKNVDDVELELEHSLVSLSKWESAFQKPFLSSKDKTNEQVLDYIKMMTLTEKVDPLVYERLTVDNYNQINDYINAKMTATWFREDRQRPSGEIVTAEIIYYWMITFNIPMECQHWHLNRLFTLIRVCAQKSAPAKKMSKSELARRNHELNAQRRAKLNTAG